MSMMLLHTILENYLLLPSNTYRDLTYIVNEVLKILCFVTSF